MPSNPLFLHDLYNCVVVDRSVSSCSDDRKVINPWILVTNVTFREKLYIARLGNLYLRYTVLICLGLYTDYAYLFVGTTLVVLWSSDDLLFQKGSRRKCSINNTSVAIWLKSSRYVH